MLAVTRIIGCWPIVGPVALLTSAAPPGRSGGVSSLPAIAAVWVAAPTAAVHVFGPPAISKPPAGEGTYRPSHFTVASVIETFERSRCIGRSRFGGLYGP